jgi:hypothetical protein
MEYFKKDSSEEISVYAPMECEPSHFYLAKYKLLEKADWIIEPKLHWDSDLDLKSLYDFCIKNNIDYFFFPDFGFYKEKNAKNKFMKTPHYFKLIKEFVYSGNKSFLFGIKKFEK